MFSSLNTYGINIPTEIRRLTLTPNLTDGFNVDDLTGLQSIGQNNPSFLSGIFGEGGWGTPALQGLGLLSGIFGSMQQMKLAKQSLNHTREMDRINLENQRKLTNASLEDRQRARVAMQGNQHQSVSDYMNKYGV